MSNPTFTKTKIPHSRSVNSRAITIGILALVVVIVLAASYGIIGMMERRAHSAAERLVSEVVKHIDDKMTEVELATQDASTIANDILKSPIALEKLTQDFVAQNSFVYGSTVAFEPDAFPDRGRSVAPYSWKTADGKVHSRQLGTETDYYQEEWYAQTKLTGENYWCEPYFDEGGAKIMMCTYSVPLKDEDGNLIAIMTADVGLEDLEEYIASINPSSDSYIILRSRNGTPLVNSDLESLSGANAVIIKGMTKIGWSVELMMTITYLMRGDTGIILIIGFILLITVLFVFFINRILSRLQQRASAEYLSVIDALSGNFICVDFVEFSDNKFSDATKEYRVSESLLKLIPNWTQEEAFSRKLDLLMDNLVYEPDKKQFYEDSRHDKVLEKLQDSDTYFIDFRLLVANVIKYYQLQISAVRKNGALTGIVAGLHSVDEQMKKEKQQQQQLEEALSMAKTASSAKSSFLFNMSHDIRTPMNAITGFTAMAKKYADDKEMVRDYLNKIDVSGQQLLMLINQVLEMSRIESGKVEFDEKPVNIKERFDTMVIILSEQAAARGLEFNPSLKDMKHYNVLADDSRMGQITLNVAGNAMKYTPEGGRIDFSISEVPARKASYGTYVFSVADTGIGMSEEFLKTIYEPFSREQNTTISKIQGTGLGLSIVKSLVDLAGGVIDVKSEPGKGTRFDITMDFRINDQASDEAADKLTNRNMSFNFKGKRALLVEDNEMNREIAKFILEDRGVEIEEAEDGDVAVERISDIAEAGNFGYFDFILMDVQMPRMNGYEATRRIRDILEPLGIHIPIIALSANAFEEDRQKSIEAGMDDHVAKPIDIDLLLTTLAKFI